MLLTDFYKNSHFHSLLCEKLSMDNARVHIDGLTGSLPAVLGASLASSFPERNMLFLIGSKEDAYYLQNDLETLLEESGLDIDKKRVLLFPTTYRKPYQTEETDNANVLMRSEVVKQLNSGRRMVVVTYPEAIAEKVVSSKTFHETSLFVGKGSKLDMDFVIDVLQNYDFDVKQLLDGRAS